MKTKSVAVAVRAFFSGVENNEQAVYEALEQFVEYNPNAYMEGFEHDGVTVWHHFELEDADSFLSTLDAVIEDIEQTFSVA